MLKGREALEGLQSSGEVIGGEIDEVLSKLIAAVVVEVTFPRDQGRADLEFSG